MDVFYKFISKAKAVFSNVNVKARTKAVLKRKSSRSSWFHVQAKVERRNWLELPESLTLRIFTKLDTTQIYVSVRHVCSHWRELAKEPILYRSAVLGSGNFLINPTNGLFDILKFGKLIDEVVALSCGQMIQFSCGAMMGLTKYDIYHVAASSVSGLKSLRLGYCENIDSHALTEIITSIPSLEELYIAFDILLKSSIEEIGNSCPRLQYFCCRTYFTKFDDLAFAIAKSMPGLRHLHLCGNCLTNTGLQAILDGCPHLEYLYLLGCFLIDFEDADFWNKQSVSGRIANKRALERTYAREYEFHLNTQLNDNDDEQSLSKPLPSNMYAAEEVNDYSLYPYSSQFVDQEKINHRPRKFDVYDAYMRLYGYEEEDEA